MNNDMLTVELYETFGNQGDKINESTNVTTLHVQSTDGRTTSRKPVDPICFIIQVIILQTRKQCRHTRSNILCTLLIIKK